MFYFRISFILLLLAGSNPPDSLTGENAMREQNPNSRYDYRRLAEARSDGDYNDGHLLFPIDIFAMSENSLESGTSERKYSRSNSSKGLRTPSLSRSGTSRQLSRNPSGLTPLLECMWNAVKLSLPPLVLGQASDQLHNFSGVIDEFSGEVVPAQLVAIAINPDTVELFVDAARSCFELFKEDGNGGLVLDGDFSTSPVAEAFKLHPMGVLAVGATETVAENVSVAYDRENKPEYKIDYTGLITGLGIAAVKTTKIGQIATKSTEGRNWLSKSVREAFEGSSFMGRDQTTLRQVALMECVANAVSSALNMPASRDPGTRDQEVSLLRLFVTAGTPCFALFERHENGRLGLGEGFPAEAIKQHSMGVLVVGAANAIVESVSATCDEDGTIRYDIDYTDLSLRLGTAVVESAEMVRTTVPPPPQEGRRRLKRTVSRFFWGPNSHFSDRLPKSVASALRFARECFVKYWESAWLTRSFSDLFRGLGPRKKIPNNIAQLVGCVTRAIATSLYGWAFRTRSKRDRRAAGEEGNEIDSNVLQSFVKKVRPCFGFFKRNEYGMLELDPAFLRGTIMEVLRVFPVGSLVAGAIESIVENVKEVIDEAGNRRFNVNYTGLGIGLSMTVLGATTFGLTTYACDLMSWFF